MVWVVVKNYLLVVIVILFVRYGEVFEVVVVGGFIFV